MFSRSLRLQTPLNQTVLLLGLVVVLFQGCASVARVGSGAGGSTISIANVSLPSGKVGTAYRATLTASGGNTPYAWSVMNGSLPSGLSLNAATGVIAGTPTQSVSNSSVTFEVMDSSQPAQSQSASLKFTIATSVEPLAITTSSLPNGKVGTNYSTGLGATGGLAPYTWSLTSGSLPGGLGLNAASGAITGTPTQATANAALTFTVADSSQPAQTQSVGLKLTIGSSVQPLAITTTSLPGGKVATWYSTTLTAVGGISPYTWSITSGTLPAGLTLNASTGAITGTPTQAVTNKTLTAKVVDASNPSLSQAVNLTISVSASVAPLSISTTSLPSGQVGTAYSAALGATGGTTPYTWSLSSGTLPAGLSLNASSGAITGTPTQSAIGVALTFKVTDSTNPALSQSVNLTMTITATAPPLSISTTTLPNGQVGTAYSAALGATGGTRPYTWSLSSGSLPAGLSLNASSGAITGTPTQSVSNSSLTFKLADSSSPALTKTATLTLTIAASIAPLNITTSSLPSGTVGTAYSAALAATGGTTPYTWSLTSGTLPAGLSLNGPTGAIFGTPTQSVTNLALTFKVTDSGNPALSKSVNLTLSIAAGVQPLAVTTTSLPSGQVGTAYSATLGATGGKTPYTWSLTSGTLPAGLALNASSGAITGTPTQSVLNAALTFKVTDSSSPVLTKSVNLTMTIAASVQPLSITTSLLPNGTVGAAYSVTLGASGGTTPYTWSLSSGTLPSGLSLNPSSGAITGTPTQAISLAALTFQVTDSSQPAQTKSAVLTMVIVSVQASNQIIGLSTNGKYLINPSTGQPVFMVAEQGFDLDQSLSNADLETYLSDRASRGYNVIWMSVVDNAYSANPPRDSQGNAPFSGADFQNMQSAYFTHLDYVLNRMAAYGITALLGPAFSGYPCSSTSGYCQSVESASTATLTAYGQYLGNRYKSFPNIIWIIGGDMDSSGNLVSQYNTLANAIKSVDNVHLMTAENIRGQSSLDVWSGKSWLNLNGIYSLPSNIPSEANSNYLRSDFLPEFMMEDWCENEHGESTLGLRTEGYWAVLSGAYLGRDFCNFPIYSFSSGWQSALSSPGSVSQEWLGKLFRSRKHWLLVPDTGHTSLTGGYGSGSTLTTAARTSDGQSIIAYIPNGNGSTITVNLARIASNSSSVQGWWFHPQTGGTVSLGSFGNSGSQQFTPPDSNDWVLVLDDASANLAAPGTSIETGP